jgi:aminopeptidase N
MAMAGNPEGIEDKRAMLEFGARRELPELKELVVEASRALARLDANRLQELALSCQALNRALAPANADERAVLARQAREAAEEMAVFARVLEATRANLNVMNRLRELRAGRLEYGQVGWVPTESRHGND